MADCSAGDYAIRSNGRLALMALLQALALCAAIVASGEAAIYLPRMGMAVAPDAAQAFTRAEFITIVLAAVTAVLAVLMILLAILAFWGYNSLREEVKKAAVANAVQAAVPIAVREARAAAEQVVGGAKNKQEDIAKEFGDDMGADSV